MIREILQKVMDEFPGARKEPFTNHPIANFMRDDVPPAFRKAFQDFPKLIWDASPGAGKWVEGPWIAAFNPLITESAQEGYYPVYLFTSTLDAVYLSMNQGVTLLKEELGIPRARQFLQNRAEVIRQRLSDAIKPEFTASPLHLGSKRKNSLLDLYEPGHAFGIRYERGNLPGEESLVHDLTKMLHLYRLALVRGGVDPLDTEPGVSYPEKRRYRYHRTIERNSKLAKQAKMIHGYRCQVCTFDFEAVYGELGHEYIEAHHLTPLSQLPEDETVLLDPKDDFAVVCANCHRMIHRKDAPESFGEFKALFGT